MAVKNKLITASNFKDFDWNKAKLFYHIAKSGSFTKAARLADTDQSVLTRQIQILEKQVGCPLLIRKVGGIALTRKGEELLAKVAPFFMEMRGFCGNAYVEMGEEKKRKIRIATTHALAAFVFSNAYPKSTCELTLSRIISSNQRDTCALPNKTSHPNSLFFSALGACIHAKPVTSQVLFG